MSSGIYHTTTTTTLNPNIYRFGGFRYGFRGTEHYGPDYIVPAESGLFPMPKGDEESFSPMPRRDFGGFSLMY